MSDCNTEISTPPYRGLVFESFARAIVGAPMHNRRAVYHLIAVDAIAVVSKTFGRSPK